MQSGWEKVVGWEKEWFLFWRDRFWMEFWWLLVFHRCILGRVSGFYLKLLYLGDSQGCLVVSCEFWRSSNQLHVACWRCFLHQSHELIEFQENLTTHQFDISHIWYMIYTFPSFNHRTNQWASQRWDACLPEVSLWLKYPFRGRWNTVKANFKLSHVQHSTNNIWINRSNTGILHG